MPSSTLEFNLFWDLLKGKCKEKPSDGFCESPGKVHIRLKKAFKKGCQESSDRRAEFCQISSDRNPKCPLKGRLDASDRGAVAPSSPPLESLPSVSKECVKKVTDPIPN